MAKLVFIVLVLGRDKMCISSFRWVILPGFRPLGLLMKEKWGKKDGGGEQKARKCNAPDFEIVFVTTIVINFPRRH